MNTLKQEIKGVLFDLDGTLMDTAEDLGLALNDLLQTRNFPAVSNSRIRPNAGYGCKGLLKIGMNVDDSHPEYTELCQELLDLYQKYCLTTTQLFPGMDNVLAELEQKGLPWGIVTNKPHRFTLELVKHLSLADRVGCVISGDTLSTRKPHPEPMIHACNLLNILPHECLYVGDSEIDVIASKAAGTPTLVALYGYIPDEVAPELWKADGYIHHPEEIMQWIK